MKDKRKGFLCLFFILFIPQICFGAWAVRSGVDLTQPNQAILPMSGPTAVIGLNLSANTSAGWPQPGDVLNSVYVSIYTSPGANHPILPEDFRKVAIYRDVGAKGVFDPADYEIGSVNPSQLGSLSFDIPINFSIYGSDDAQNGTQGPDLWVVIFTSDKISGDMPGGYDYRNKFIVRVGWPLSIGTNTIICDSRVVDLVPMRSDSYDPSSLTEINGYPTISSNVGVFRHYLYGPLYNYRAYEQEHPLFQFVAQDIDFTLAVPELCGMCIPYRVIGFSLKGRSTYSGNDNEQLSRVTVIIEDTGIPGNFDPGMLASHQLSPYSNIAIYRDNGDGYFNPANDIRILASNVIPGTPHMQIDPLPPSPEGNNRWKVTFNFSGINLDQTADGLVDFFVVIATDPSHGWVTNRPWYGSDFKIYIDPSVYDDGIVVTRPIGESPDPSIYRSPTLTRTRDKVKDVRIAFDIKPNLIDGPIEADGVPIPIFHINMTDSWGPFAQNEALQWIRVWFKGENGFKPNKLMPLSDDQDSGVSLWLDNKTGGTLGLPDSRTITENDMLSSIHRVTISDTFVPLDASSLEWYNSDGTKWSPTNDDPANPNDDDKRYFVVLKPKSPILLHNDDYIQGNDYPGRQENRGFDLFICIKPRGISVPETAYKSNNTFERGIDYGMSVRAAIGLTKYNDRPSIINNYPWEDILFTNGYWARIFPDNNRDGIYEPIETFTFPATVPTFFTNLTYSGQSINRFTKTPVIGINLVAPPGKNISFSSMSLIIIDNNNPPTLDFSELVKPNSDPNDPDGGCGIALYKDTNRNGIFDPLDKRVWMTKLPYLLPRAADDPQGRFRVRLEFGDPPPNFTNHTSVGYIPTNDVGQNAGPDYFLVIQPNENMDPGDRFHILLWGSNLVGENTLTFTGDAGGITYKRVITYTLTNTTVTATIFTDLTTSGQIIDATSDPIGVIGISAWDHSTGTNQLQKIRVYFNPEEGIFPDTTPFSEIIAPLTNNILSGVSIWRDTNNNDIFDWRADTLIPVSWSSWKSDYVDGFVDGDGTTTSGQGYKTQIINWQGKVLSYFNWDDRVYWYDANNDSIWSLEDCLWLDNEDDGIFNSQTDKVIVGTTPSSGTFGEKLHQGAFGFVFYDEDQDGKYTDGDDIYFVGRGRNCLGWYLDGVFPQNISLPTTNTGNEFFVAIRTSNNLLYGDKFSISLPSNGLVFSSGYSFANINLKTHTLTGNLNVKLTYLIPSNNYVIPPTYDCPAIGINLFDGKRDGTDGGRYLKEIVIYYTGNLYNLKQLTTDGSLSGIALFKESGINSGWDIDDLPINLKSISFSGNKIVLTLPDSVYAIPNDDTGSNSGDDYYIILRTSENAVTGETFRVEIRNDLSVPLGFAGDRIKFDQGTSGEYLVGTNAIIIGQPIVLNAPQIISATPQFVNGKWQVVLNWLDNSENPDEDGFEIQRRIGTTGTWQTIGQVGRDITTFTDDNSGNGLTPDTTYYYRVRAFITTPPTYSTWSNIVNVTTSTGQLQDPTNLTGYAEYLNGKWRIVLNWTDNSENPEEDGFIIERKIGSGNFVEIGTVGRDITTYIDDENGAGLTENTSYSYRVRGYRDIVSGRQYSNYTNEITLTTTRPNKPTNLLPPNNATGVSIIPTLQASNYSHPTNVNFAGSQWQIRLENSTYNNPVYDSGEIGAVTSHQVPSGRLSFNTKYFWHVRYKDVNGGWSDWSDETSFTTRTNSAPLTPTGQSPTSGAVGITLTPTLTGSAFSDPDGDSFLKAQWRIRQSGSSTYIWQAETTTTSISVPSGILLYSTTYYWQVRYQDQWGTWSNWSNEASFTTMPKPQNPPRKPENLYPVNGATGVSLTPLLVATGFYDQDGDTMSNSQWRLWESTGSSSSPYWQNLNAGAVTSILVSASLQEGKTYYWQVRYQDSDGMWSEWSDPTYFTTLTITPPPPPEPGGGGCFIASVCFGENSWQVRILKEFRDKILIKNYIGKKFVKFYYKISPDIAEYLRTHKLVLLFTRFLLYFIIILVCVALSKILIYISIILIFLTLFWKWKRKSNYCKKWVK